MRIYTLKVKQIDESTIDVKGYDIDEDGKADIVTRDSDKDGVVDTYEFYKDGKKIQERHFEDGELIKTDYYDEDGNLISGEMPEPEVSPKSAASEDEVQRIHRNIRELYPKEYDLS